MATMDIFNSNAFSAVEMTRAVEKIDYLPMLLGSMNLFEPVPLRVTSVSIEARDRTLSLIQTSKRGAPISQQTSDKANVRNFNTVRVAKGDAIYAAEIQNIRAFGTESELKQVATEVAYRQSKLRMDMELTHENMRLGAIQGIVKDADGSTLFDWYSEWGVTQPTEINFALNVATTEAREKCAAVSRAMQRAAKGAWLPTTRIIGLADDTFFDDLVKHASVKDTYKNWQAAADLRAPQAFESFRFGGIDFINYRGTDDNSTVAVAAGKCKFFPMGAPGVFQVAWAPGESFDLVNRPGQPVVSWIVPDRDRNTKVDVELYSYPLYVCTRPLMLQRAANA